MINIGHRPYPQPPASTRNTAPGHPLAVFLALCATLVPLTALAQPRAGGLAEAPDERLGQALVRAEGVLETLGVRFAEKRGAAHEKAELRAIRETLDSIDDTELDEFGQVETHLRRVGAAPVILERHAEAVRAYRSEMAALKATLDAVQAAPPGEAGVRAATRARQQLEAKRPRGRARLDPSRLPTRVLEPNRGNAPKLSPAEFRRADLDSNPTVRIASAAPLALLLLPDLPGAGDPAFLGQTVEIGFTAAVRARAAELGRDPVRIFNWAHDHLEWNPGWGAIQSAEHTLGSGRGNAIDLSGALVALLRVSGIPARYVHGTVEMDADRFRILAGDFDNAGAAVDFASASGLPIAAVVSGGRIARVRFEHVWVEAAVDFFPSRGAVNRVADRWVDLDPTIKRVLTRATPDYAAVSEVPVESVMQAFARSGAADPDAGWRQGLDTAALAQGLVPAPAAQAQVAAAARAFFEETYRPADTVSLAQIAGGIRVEPRTDGVLPSSLPYSVLVVGARYAQIPPALQAEATISFGLDLEGAPVAPVTLPLARVNNQPLSISFTFASLADHDAYVSFLPAGEVTSLSQLPASIPGYLISVVPQIRLGDDVITSTTPVRLGETVGFGVALRLPGVVGGRDRLSSVIAGSQLAVVVCAGSANTAEFERLRQRYAEAEPLLESGSVDDILAYASNFTSRLSGDAFHAGALEYFARRLTDAELITTGARLGRFQLVAGVASFGYVPTVRFRFGIPRTLALGVLQVDAPNLLVNVQSHDGDPELRRLLMLRIGMLGSSLEAEVPAFLWSPDLTTPDTGASAANNLRRALEAGQRIYHLTQRNRGSIAQLQLSAEAISDITAAVDAGLEVITHQLPITVAGPAGSFTTAGYVVLDPVTGAGQYLLDNGTNGGVGNTADDMMAICANTNRPGFVDNGVDWARHQITRKCAEFARSLKGQAEQINLKRINAKIKAIKDYHEIFAKVPMVVADCITVGAPLILSDILVQIRSAAILLAFQAADLRSLVITELHVKLAKKMKQLVEVIHSYCNGRRP